MRHDGCCDALDAVHGVNNTPLRHWPLEAMGPISSTFQSKAADVENKTNFHIKFINLLVLQKSQHPLLSAFRLAADAPCRGQHQELAPHTNHTHTRVVGSPP